MLVCSLNDSFGVAPYGRRTGPMAVVKALRDIISTEGLEPIFRLSHQSLKVLRPVPFIREGDF